MGEKERVRVRSRDPIPDGGYEKLFREREEFVVRQHSRKLVIKPRERDWDLTRQGFVRWYLHPLLYKDTPLQDWYTFMLDIRTHSGRHRHQGGLVIFIVEGSGGTEVDGERLLWQAGDLLLLPVKPGGVEHKHYNAEPGKGCRWLAFLYLPLWNHVGSELAQLELSPDFIERYGEVEGLITGQAENKLGTQFYRSQEGGVYGQDHVAGAGENGPKTLYHQLLEIRDRQRARRKDALWLVRDSEREWENNPQGIMQWMMHPALDNIVMKTMMIYKQEIPPGSRSGRQRFQGNMVMYIMKGKGHTKVDATDHPWEEGDVIQIPIRRDGVITQHFNDDPKKPCRFVTCEPNLVHCTSVDRGSGFVQIESSPDYGRNYEPEP
jgi:quercetin dioxygenase-like cupin family protein